MKTHFRISVISLMLLISITGIVAADTLVINSDSTWKVNQNLVSGWNTTSFDDSGWSSPRIIGAPPMSPWGSVGMTPTGANWIWTSDNNVNIYRYFRKEFVIPGNPTTGNVRITVDNEYTLYVNGDLIGSDNNWQNSESYNIISKLHQGTNVIAVRGIDRGNPAGLLLDSTITYSNQIPEFPTIAIPVLAIIGLLFVLYRKKQ